MGFLSNESETRDEVAKVGNVAVDPALLAQQQNFVSALQAQANGQGPSLATNMLEQQAQQNAANATSMAQGQRGTNAGLAQRNAMNAAGQANAQAGQQAANARIQEQNSAQQQLGGQLNLMQNQNLGVQQQNQNIGMGKAQLISGAAGSSGANIGNVIGSGLNAAGSAAAAVAASDERVKTHIRDGSGDAYAFLDSLSPHKYEYKDPSAPGQAPGPQLGVMAQDVEKGAPQMVLNTPNGKMLDAAKAVGPQLAALSDLHERLKRLEGGDAAPQKLAQGGMVGLGANPFDWHSMQMNTPTTHMDLTGGAKAMGKAVHAGMKDKGGPGAPAGPEMVGAPTMRAAPMPMALAQGGMARGPASQAAQHLSGKVDAMVSPGEVYVPPHKVHAKDPIAAGEKVPGKPKVKGDSLANDVVPKKLEQGGVVIPNSVMQSKDPHTAAARFVAHILASKGLKK